jgi:hypothetical protein
VPFGIQFFFIGRRRDYYWQIVALELRYLHVICDKSYAMCFYDLESSTIREFLVEMLRQH